MKSHRTQEENDYLLAIALQESEREEAQRRRTTVSIEKTCLAGFVHLVNSNIQLETR